MLKALSDYQEGLSVPKAELSCALKGGGPLFVVTNGDQMKLQSSVDNLDTKQMVAYHFSQFCYTYIQIIIATTSYVGGYFGQGTGLIVFGNTQCNGSESSLWSCQHSSAGNCSHLQDAGVSCSGM